MEERPEYFAALLQLQDEGEIITYFETEAEQFIEHRREKSEEILTKLKVLDGLVGSTKSDSPTLTNHLVRIYEGLKTLEDMGSVYVAQVKKVFELMYVFTNPRNIVYTAVTQLLTPHDEELFLATMSVSDLMKVRDLLAKVQASLQQHSDLTPLNQPLLNNDSISQSTALTRRLIDSINICAEKAMKNPVKKQMRSAMRSNTAIDLPASFEAEENGTMTMLLPYIALFLFALTETFLRVVDEEMMKRRSAMFWFVTKEIYLLIGFVCLFAYNYVLNTSLRRAILVSSLVIAIGTAGTALTIHFHYFRLLGLARSIVATGGPVLISRRYQVDLESNFSRTKACALYNFAYMMGSAFAYFFLQFVHTYSRLNREQDEHIYVGVILTFSGLWMVLVLLTLVYNQEPMIKHSHLDHSYSLNGWMLLNSIFILSGVFFFVENIAITKGQKDFNWSSQYGETFLAAFYMVVAPMNFVIAIGSYFIMDRRFVLTSIWLSAASLAVMVNLQQTSFILSCLTILLAYNIIRGPAYSLYSKLEPKNPALRASIVELLAFIVAEAMAAESVGFETKCYACCGCLILTLITHYLEKCWFKLALEHQKVA